MYLENEFCHFEAAVQYSSERFQRNFLMKVEDFTAFREANKQHGLFTTAYRYNQENIREADMIGNLYLDFDVSDIDRNFYHIKTDAIRTLSALKSIFGISPESIEIFFSGSKGIHFVIPMQVLGVQPHPELNMVFKGIAEDMNKLTAHQTIDTGIYDKVRLFRVPNSLHPSTGLYKVPLTLDELRTLSLEDIKEIASQPRPRVKVNTAYSTQANRMYQDYVKQWEKEMVRIEANRKKSSAVRMNFMPPCIQHILSEGALDGKRNNTASVLASYFLQRGVSKEEALDRVLEWNNLCVPPSNESELAKTVRSIFRAEHRYGCRALKELSICSSSCRLYKEDDRRK